MSERASQGGTIGSQGCNISRPRLALEQRSTHGCASCAPAFPLISKLLPPLLASSGPCKASLGASLSLSAIKLSTRPPLRLTSHCSLLAPPISLVHQVGDRDPGRGDPYQSRRTLARYEGALLPPRCASIDRGGPRPRFGSWSWVSLYDGRTDARSVERLAS